MVMAPIVPELIITWAAQQFFSAREAALEWNNAFDTQQREDSAPMMFTEIPRLDDRNSPSLSAPKATGRKFKGRFTLPEFSGNQHSATPQNGQ
jgi:hypothetical protein